MPRPRSQRRGAPRSRCLGHSGRTDVPLPPEPRAAKRSSLASARGRRRQSRAPTLYTRDPTSYSSAACAGGAILCNDRYLQKLLRKVLEATTTFDSKRCAAPPNATMCGATGPNGATLAAPERLLQELVRLLLSPEGDCARRQPRGDRLVVPLRLGDIGSRMLHDQAAARTSSSRRCGHLKEHRRDKGRAERRPHYSPIAGSAALPATHPRTPPACARASSSSTPSTTQSRAARVALGARARRRPVPAR